MNKGRLEAFTDAVIAIILTILVLELQPPHSGSLASLWQLRGVFAIYLVSFLTLIVTGIIIITCFNWSNELIGG